MLYVLSGDAMRYEILKYENIRKLRINSGYTQAQIAAYLRRTQVCYANYENGIFQQRCCPLWQISTVSAWTICWAGLTKRNPIPPASGHKYGTERRECVGVLFAFVLDSLLIYNNML